MPHVREQNFLGALRDHRRKINAMSSRYGNSERQLATARNLIPLGAQTFSKSVTQLPLGAAPFFAERARGSRLFDVDGNEYVDFINALAAVSLGYCDPDVDAAVVEQRDLARFFPYLIGSRVRSPNESSIWSRARKWCFSERTDRMRPPAQFA
jgi:4-aminobutyrate aminotransferase-like enzyme